MSRIQDVRSAVNTCVDELQSGTQSTDDNRGAVKAQSVPASHSVYRDFLPQGFLDYLARERADAVTAVPVTLPLPWLDREDRGSIGVQPYESRPAVTEVPRRPRCLIGGCRLQEGSFTASADSGSSAGASLPAPESSFGEVLDHWMTGVVPDTLNNRIQLAGLLGPMIVRDRGWFFHYDLSWDVLDGGVVAACRGRGRADRQGLLVNLPGAVCASLGDRLFEVMALIAREGRFTRTDLAMDDRSGLLARDRIGEAIYSKRLVSRARKTRLDTAQENGKDDGWTWYIGSQHSNMSVRVYDKAAEQGVPGPWVRLEVVARHEFADALTRQVLSEGSTPVIEQLNRYMRFTERSPSDSNKWRWRAVDWWWKFMGTLKRGVALVVGKEGESSIERAEEYLEKQWGAWLAAILEAHHGDLSWFSGMTDRGRKRYKTPHLAALALARASP